MPAVGGWAGPVKDSIAEGQAVPGRSAHLPAAVGSVGAAACPHREALGLQGGAAELALLMKKWACLSGRLKAAWGRGMGLLSLQQMGGRDWALASPKLGLQLGPQSLD